MLYKAHLSKGIVLLCCMATANIAMGHEELLQSTFFMMSIWLEFRYALSFLICIRKGFLVCECFAKLLSAFIWCPLKFLLWAFHEGS